MVFLHTLTSSSNKTTMMSIKLMSITPGMPTPSSSSSQFPSSPLTMTSSQPLSTSAAPASSSPTLPLRTIPGSYGWPLLGPMLDRLDYFWFQGPETFFKKRMEKYKSTVYRANVPPSFPFIRTNPNVIAVLDTKSLSQLFDMEIVEKSNVLVGDFVPSLKYTGNLRVCSYLDTTEPEHTKLKAFALDILKRSSKVWVSEVISNLDTMWDSLDASMAKDGSASLLIPLQKFLFTFLSKAIAGADPATTPEIAESGYAMFDFWLAFMLLPIQYVGALQPLEEIFLHSWQYPFILVSGRYKKLYDYLEKQAKETIQRGETEFGLTNQEAVHNLLFVLGFNAYGGFSIFLPSVMSYIGSDTTGLQERLRKEVREKCGSTLSFESIKDMELVKSVVYESLRYSPPVPTQYARARKDFQLTSHDSVFNVKKGELLCGYQKIAMRDPKVFDDPDTFKPDRFKDNPELLNYLYWSNGPQTGSPSEANKQCAGKDYVTQTACLFVAYLFQRYDSFTYSSGKITALQKAT